LRRHDQRPVAVCGVGSQAREVKWGLLRCVDEHRERTNDAPILRRYIAILIVDQLVPKSLDNAGRRLMLLPILRRLIVFEREPAGGEQQAQEGERLGAAAVLRQESTQAARLASRWRC
jgi:hypothetical protein